MRSPVSTLFALANEFVTVLVFVSLPLPSMLSVEAPLSELVLSLKKLLHLSELVLSLKELLHLQGE